MVKKEVNKIKNLTKHTIKFYSTLKFDIDTCPLQMHVYERVLPQSESQLMKQMDVRNIYASAGSLVKMYAHLV